ncbi:MAG: hypothetical protein ACRDD7_09985 [Peptostreptococcaceae bacterium]
MIEQINIKLNNAKSEVAKKYVLENKLENLKNELHKGEAELRNLEESLRKEKKDVDNLKKVSLANIMCTVMGNKAEKMEKEEKEYVFAKIKYDNCFAKVNLLKSDINDVISRISKLRKYESEYSLLLKEKLNLINILGNDITKAKIMEMEDRIDTYLKEIKEIDESILVGGNLMCEIEQAKKLLSSAKSWSTFDLLGGDLLSSMAKHNKIEEAQNHFYKISNLLTSFNNELSDVNISGITFSSTTKTFDIFFDNLFSDLAVDKHINKSYENVCNLERDVNRILCDLRCNKDKLSSYVEYEKDKYNDFIKNI